MVVDSSAMMAILLREPERMEFLQRIAADGQRLISVISYMECSMVMSSRTGKMGLEEFDALLKRLRLELMAVDTEQAIFARTAFMRFGKGNHPARLNLGDCFSYALARSFGEPLLFKGDDFGRTDVMVA